MSTKYYVVYKKKSARGHAWSFSIISSYSETLFYLVIMSAAGRRHCCPHVDR